MRQQTFVSEASKSKGKKGATPMAPPMLARNHPGNTIAVQTTQLRPLRPGVPVLEPSAGAIFALQRILANRLWSVSLLPLVVAAILAAAPAAALDVRQNVGFSAVNLNPWTGGADFEKTFPVLDDLQVDFQADIPNLGVTPTGFLADLLGIDADILSASIGGSASGRVGVDFGYHVNGGRLNVNYPAVAQLEVGTIPGTNAVRAGSQFSIASSFKPGLERAYLPVRSTLLSVGGPGYGETSIPGFSFDVFETPSFSTTFPNASVWADAYFDVDASVYAEARGLAIAGFCAACIRKDFKVDLPEQRFRIVEVDRDSVYVPGLVNLPLDQPIPISNFASVQLSYPDVRVESGALEADGTLRGAGAKPVIQVFGSIDDFIPLVGAFLDGSIPPIDYTLASTDGGPTLGLYQDLQLDVSPKVQLEFSEAVLARDATGEFSLTRTVEFALGQQVDVRTVFGSSGAITVKPTYDLGATFRNETGLSLGVGLEVKGPEFTLGDLGSLGPLGSERLDLEIARYPLFQDSFTIDAGGQITGDPFTIRKDLGAVLFPDVTASASALALDVGDCTGTGIGGQVRCWASYVNPFNGDAGELEVTGTLLRLPLEDPFGGQLDTFQEILVADSEILLELNGFDPEEPSAYAAFSLGDALCVFCADLSGLFEMTSPFVEEAGEKLFLSSLFEYSDGEICLECDPVLSQSNLFSQLGAPTTITETSATEPVPEPGTLALLGIGLAVLTSLGRSTRRALPVWGRAELAVADGGRAMLRMLVTLGVSVGSTFALALPPTAAATLQVEVAAVGGSIGAGPLPAGCTTYSAPPVIRSYVFGTNIVPNGGIAPCGYAGGVRQTTGSEPGQVTDQQSVVASYADGTSITGDAQARAGYGGLGVLVSATRDGGSGGTDLGGVTAIARSVETFPGTFGGTPGTPGTIQFGYGVIGAMSNDGGGTSTVQTRLSYRVNGVPDFGQPWFSAALNGTQEPFLPFSPANGQWTTSPGSLSGGAVYYTQPISFTFGTPFDMDFALMAFASPAFGTATADLLSSATLLAIEVRDGQGQLLTDWEVVGASGTRYGPAGVVPEPTTGALLALGLGGLAWRGRRARFGQDDRRLASRTAAPRWRKGGPVAALLALLAVLASARADATVIAEYDFTGGSLASTDLEPNSTAGPLAFTLATTGISAPGNPAPGLRIIFTPTITVSVVLGTLTLTPAPGFTMDLDSLTFDASLQYEAQAGGGQAFFGLGVRSNLDGFASLLGSTSWFASASTPGFAARSIDLSSLQGLTAETLAGVGGSLQLQLLVGGGSILIDPDITTIDNLVVNGTVVPEPGPLALLAVGLGGLALLSNDPARKRGADTRALSDDTGD